MIYKVDRRTVEQISNAMIDRLQPLADRSHTTTGDNGIEITDRERIAKNLGVDFFFTHPYAAWEHGANEFTCACATLQSMKGLVHQYVPKNRKHFEFRNDYLEQNIIKLKPRPIKSFDFM